MQNCTQCRGAIKGAVIEEPDGAVLHDDCVMQYRSNSPGSNHAASALQERIILTTAHSVIGRNMVREIEIVTAECVFGANVFRDLFSSVRDIVGGRARGQQNVLRDAKNTCMHELELAAMECGADAVIGIDLDYQEISGGGKSMLFLVASGTAIALEPNH